MRNAIRSIAVSLSLIFVGSTAMGAGFALYEFSARGNAMGGAVVANKAEAASLAVNPSLITQIEGSEVQAGVTFVIPHATTGVDVGAGYQNSSLKDRVFALPNFYTTYQASESVFLGLAGFSRFGLGGEYKNYKTWPGSMMSYKFDVVSYSLTPVIATKVTDSLSMSMGLEFMYLSFSEDKWYAAAAPPAVPAPNSNIGVEGDGTSWGGNFGLFYKPEWAEKWGLGLSYRTKMRQVLDGKLNASLANGAVKQSSDVRGSVTLPDALTMGVSFQPDEKLVLEASLIGTFWSSYDSIRIDYKANDNSIIEAKKYKDTVRLGLGAEYALNNTWDLRTGYVYDQSPTNKDYMDTLVPVGDRHIFNIGAGYKREVWGLDLAYSYLLGVNMTGHGEIGGNPVGVKYTNAGTHMIAATFKYKFGRHFLRGGK